MNQRTESINGVKIPCDKSILELEKMLDMEMAYFNVACIALGYKGDEKSLKLLSEVLLDKDWCKRRLAIEALSYHKMAYSLKNELIKLLDDTSKYVVITTLRTIKVHCIKEAYNKVIELTKSLIEEVRKEAVECLCEVGSVDDFQLVIHIYSYDQSNQVKDVAAWFIRQRACENNWKQAVEILSKGKLARHREWALELIDIYWDESVIYIIRDLLNDKDGHVRKKANKIKNNHQYE
ncbi:HEAT repeat domain-containing protein [Haloplasma contractile]|uniref:HEAT repeat domain-containing protein n=1 Tax=Haloplasma contractile SSD-17B TaxID=1033810 RepID=F7PWW7_9MOLU|nr:HEAT repeat domain-containing protein [Haloplasma contractile]ERJ12506.1 hypothetical protein HLPCO_001492 [Haloplasma contractile SSD-17B]